MIFSISFLLSLSTFVFHTNMYNWQNWIFFEYSQSSLLFVSLLSMLSVKVRTSYLHTNNQDLFMEFFYFSVTSAVPPEEKYFWHVNIKYGNCTVRWENDSMYCIVYVFGLAIWAKIYLCTYKLVYIIIE